jgi:hypothetical protein
MGIYGKNVNNQNLDAINIFSGSQTEPLEMLLNGKS